MSKSLLDLNADELLKEFGRGEGFPGSGSVAVHTALSGTELLVSICKLTVLKDAYKEVHDEMNEIQKELEEVYRTRLKNILATDSRIVDEMLQYRIMRDKEQDADRKEEFKQRAFDLLEKATDSMITLSKTCLDIIPMALHAYNVGLRSARGDSGVVLSNLLSGASSGLYMALMNVRAAHDCDWVADKKAEVEICFGRLHEYQYIFSGRLAALYNNSF